MHVVLLTREYPPEVYGGAGVHVEYLSRELARVTSVEVRCFGPAREPESPGGSFTVRAYTPWDALAEEAPHLDALQAVSVDLAMAAGLDQASLVHSHTWYTNLAGHLAKLLHAIPHVMTSHSLEPLRPWKAEQLGRGGYAVACFCERTAIEAADAVVAVSDRMREDVLSCYPKVEPERVVVIRNGIDADEYRPDPATDVLEAYGIVPGRPIVLFVGRVTRQKGLTHLLDAARYLDREAQLVLCAGAPDTPDIGAEIAAKVQCLQWERAGVVWIDRMLERRGVIQLMSHATVFVCPSLYEPLGIVNLEAMACGTAVVATATGGIPEVVEEGVTGYLVPFEPREDGTLAPRDPEAFARALAERVNALIADPALAAKLGEAGRQRAVERFSWKAVAEQTLALYRRLLEA
jgi:alpha-maltose-1-phosphate synthase